MKIKNAYPVVSCAVGSAGKITVVVPNLKGEPREFELESSDRFVKLLYDYDDAGEPINVRLKGVDNEYSNHI